MKVLLTAITFSLSLTFSASAQNIEVNLNSSSNYSFPNDLFGVNTVGSFPFYNNKWTRFLDKNNGLKTLLPGFTDLVSDLGFTSYYYPGGSIARAYHYSAESHGYGFKLSEAIYIDSAYNNLNKTWGTSQEKHDHENQYYWENDISFNKPHDLPPSYLIKHRDLCKITRATATVSVNVPYSHPSELKQILDSFLNDDVMVNCIVMGTEFANSADSAYFPNGVVDYVAAIEPFLNMLRDPQNPLHETRFATIPIAACVSQIQKNDPWNSVVTEYMASNYGLPPLGAANWFWYTDDCASPMVTPKECMDEYFSSMPTRIDDMKQNFSGFYLVQYGIGPSPEALYENTFLSEYFLMKNLFYFIDYNAVHGEFFKGAFLMSLAASTSYNPIWDNNSTTSIEINKSAAFEGLVLKKEVIGKEYSQPIVLPQTNQSAHAEAFYFHSPDSCQGKLFLLNASGVADTLRSIRLNDLLISGDITIRTTSAPTFTTEKSGISPLVTGHQTSLTGNYEIIIPGYSIIVVDFNLTAPEITVTSSVSSICNGSSSTFAASGAAFYAWLPATGLSSTTGSQVIATPGTTTTYTVTGISENGCVNTASTMVTVSSLPTILITPETPVILAGNAIEITASGAATYQWGSPAGLSDSIGSSVTASPSVTTTYTVTGASSAGCKSEKSVTVTVSSNCPLPPNVLATSITDTSVVLNWDVTENSIKYKVRYKLSGTKTWNTHTQETNSYEITGLAPATKYLYGVKSICKTVPNLNSGWTKNLKFTTLTQRLDLTSTINIIEIYPNPVSSTFAISLSLNENSIVRVQLFNGEGKFLRNVIEENLSAGSQSFHINAEQLNPGVYYLCFSLNNDVSWKKVIKIN